MLHAAGGVLASLEALPQLRRLHMTLEDAHVGGQVEALARLTRLTRLEMRVGGIYL